MFANYISDLLIILENLNKYYIFNTKYYGENCSNIKSTICEIQSLKVEIEKLTDNTDSEQINYFNCIKNYISDLILNINYNQITSNNKLSYFIYPVDNLLITINPDSTITLTWDIITKNESGYLIQRSFDGENWSNLTTIDKNENNYNDLLNDLGEDISEVETIFYRLFTIRNGKCSTPSMVVSVDIIIGPPTNLQSTLSGIDDVTLTWINNTVFPVNYEVQRSTTSGSGYVTIDTITSSETSYEDLDLVNNTTYYYRLCIEASTDCSNEVSEFIPIPFSSTWNTSNTSTGSSNSDQISLPLIPGTLYDFLVDWGDGTTDTITQWDQPETTHTYTLASTYNVQIIGILRGWLFGGTGDRLKILDIDLWGSFQPTGTDVFENCSNLDVSATDIIDLSQTVSMNSFFFGCITLQFNNSINSWDVSNITSFNSMFQNCFVFNQPLNNWVTSSVTSFRDMFHDARDFNQYIGDWNVLSVNSFERMFRDALDYDQPLTNWVLSTNALVDITMNGMFQFASSFNQDINNLNTVRVTNMSSVFNAAVNYNQPLNNWNVTNATNFNAMFASSGFNQDISSWVFPNCTSMLRMFEISPFNQDISSWNTSNVTNMSRMFNSTNSFNQDISSWNTGNVTNMSSMFQNQLIFNQDISSWNTSNVTNMSNMFVNHGSFNQNLSSWDITSLTIANAMFENSPLDDANYQALLVAWEAQAEQSSVIFHGGNARYQIGGPSETARNNLIGISNWTISDGGGI